MGTAPRLVTFCVALTTATVHVSVAGSGDDLVFSPPVLIEAKAGFELHADGFGAVEVDPSGDSTLLHGPKHWTSYDSGRTWRSEVPQGWQVKAFGPQETWSGESSGFRAPGTMSSSMIHNLGVVGFSPPPLGHANTSFWAAQRSLAWTEGCHNSTPPLALSQTWLTTSPSASFWHKNATDGKLWTSSKCQGVAFRGLPRELNESWGMCNHFTGPTRLELADGSTLATFALVFAGEEQSHEHKYGWKIFLSPAF